MGSKSDIYAQECTYKRKGKKAHAGRGMHPTRNSSKKCSQLSNCVGTGQIVNRRRWFQIVHVLLYVRSGDGNEEQLVQIQHKDQRHSIQNELAAVELAHKPPRAN